MAVYTVAAIPRRGVVDIIYDERTLAVTGISVESKSAVCRVSVGGQTYEFQRGSTSADGKRIGDLNTRGLNMREIEKTDRAEPGRSVTVIRPAFTTLVEWRR